jgi:hypothetical protein
MMLWGMDWLVDKFYYIWHLKLIWDIGVRHLDNTIIKGSDTGKIHPFNNLIIGNEE